jgi:cysteine sulfinate desulfinase/cysteine desulfurase-like protein
MREIYLDYNASTPIDPVVADVMRRVVNLMEALRRSVAEDTKGAAARKGASATPARKRA